MKKVRPQKQKFKLENCVALNPLSSDAPSCARKQNPSEIPMRPHAPCHI